MSDKNFNNLRQLVLTTVTSVALLVSQPLLAQSNDQQGDTNVADTTLVYGADYFKEYPSAQNAWDIVKRIPGAEQIAGGGQRQGGYEQNSRGFSSNDDRVLINGKRISGKQNNSRDALQRITMDRVERIEIIRGSSPDIKVSSQEALLNVVLKEGVSTGSGTWTVEGRYLEDGRVRVGAEVSYGDSLGPVDYFISAERRTRHLTFDQIDTIYDANENLLEELREEEIRERFNHKVSANLIFNLDSGDQLRLNGLYEDGSNEVTTPGMLYFPDADGNLQLAADALRVEDTHEPQWEVGGDWETSLSDNWTFKILALYTNRVDDKVTREDGNIDPNDPTLDFIFDQDEKATEAISRGSVTWNIAPGRSLELGTEVAQNKLKTALDYQENEGGVLVPVVLDEPTKEIKEFRDESFANLSLKLTDKLSVDTSAVFEYSKITQNSDLGQNSRKFQYFKPSIDGRYNISTSDQFQLSVRRTVEQLNFGDFASSVTRDDEVILGNQNLVPEKQWQFEAAYEHRLDQDAGRVKLSVRHDEVDDRVTNIPFPTQGDPLATAKGNIEGRAYYRRYRLDGNLRMVWFDMPQFVINGHIEVRDTGVDSPFTGERVIMDYRDTYQLRVNARHDITEWGFSYGVRYDRDGPTKYYQIDEIIRVPFDRSRLDIWAEYNIYSDWILRLHLENVLDSKEGRIRDLYDAGIASGVLTGQEYRDRRGGIRLLYSLRGTF